VARLESFMRIDEEQHYLAGHLLEATRKLILMSERLLLEAGALEREGSVFHLTLGELKEALGDLASGIAPRQLAALAERRSAELERARRNPPPFELPAREAEAYSTGERKISGLPVSPGLAVGRVHFAEHLSHADGLEAGSVLVTTAPNPALTPYYPMLAAVVSTTGGPLSHGFVAAREYGLPAVSKVADAASRLSPGALVRVDGTSGTVEILEAGA
jgi:pyruvate,water dikinase